jgi:hypothetical protein
MHLHQILRNNNFYDDKEIKAVQANRSVTYTRNQAMYTIFLVGDEQSGNYQLMRESKTVITIKTCVHIEMIAHLLIITDQHIKSLDQR